MSDTPETFEEKVNAVVALYTQDADGNLTLPEDVEAEEAVLYAAKLEKRRRDTQSAYTKAQQSLKKAAAEAQAFAEAWEADAVASLSATEQSELEELKHTDPDKWRHRIVELETARRNKFTERKQAVQQKASHETEVEMRARVLEEFSQAHPGFNLTDEVIENDIPPRFTKQLEKGEVSFEEFLDKCHKYLTAGKVVAPGEPPVDMVDLSAVPGASAPAKASVDKDIISSYRSEVF